MIRADLDLLPGSADDPDATAPAPPSRGVRARRSASNPLGQQPFPPLAAAPAPSWARASGRAGQGDPLFAAGAGLALLDAFLRRDPPAAKVLRVNGDESALRDLRFAIGDAGLAPRLLQLWRALAGRPPSLDSGRILAAGAALDLLTPNPNALAESLRERVRGGEDPVSAAAKAAAAMFSAFPDAPAAEAEILALWLFDLAIAIRLRWARPLPLIATKILDPALRPPDGSPRPRPGDRAWPSAAAGAIALAAASALDLAADLSRRSETLIAVAPKLRSKAAAKIVDLLLAEDCLAPAEAARQAPMTGRAARRLFDRLLALGAAREFSGRPTFRLYGL